MPVWDPKAAEFGGTMGMLEDPGKLIVKP